MIGVGLLPHTLNSYRAPIHVISKDFCLFYFSFYAYMNQYRRNGGGGAGWKEENKNVLHGQSRFVT